jgi:hypothetical protein
MKVLIPISLFLFGLLSFLSPFVIATHLGSGALPPWGIALVFSPMALGLLMFGFGVFFAFKCFSEK